MLRIAFLLLLICSPLSAEINSEFIKDLYQPSNVKDFKLSPSGRYAAAIYHERDFDFIDVYDLTTRQGKNIQVGGSQKVRFKTVEWVDETTVLVYWNNRVNDKIAVFHLDYVDGNISVEKKFDLPIHGNVLNHLPEEENTIIFAKRSANFGYQDFYKVDISEEKTSEQLSVKENKLPLKFKNVTDWAFDRNNQLRFIEIKKEEEFIYYYLKQDSNKWIETARSAESELNYFYAIDNQERLIALVKKDDDRRIVAYFDLNNMQQIEVAYENPLYDVSAPILDVHNELVGVRLVNQGASEQFFFDESLENIKKIILQRRGNQRAYIVDSNLNRDKFLLLASKNGFHFKYYDYDLVSDKLMLTKDPNPWLKKLNFSDTKTFNIPKSDGTVVEAYLSLPPNTKTNIPLIVNPHGGPFGVRDYKYDNETEILAAHGFAVLRVNFRGSSGFGDNYIDSAKQGFGTIIEEDIFQSLEYVLSRFPIDKNKICSYGISYGGYSTAMLLAKHPDVFKCGVSFAGVFDLNLQINEAKRFSLYRDGLDEYFKNYIADIESEPELQKQKSPVFHASKLQAPLLLIHGTNDSVVDIEQSYRMHYALQAHGLDSELHILDEFIHGFRNTEDRVLFFEKVIPFFEESFSKN